MGRISFCPLSGERRHLTNKLEACGSCCWCHPNGKRGVASCDIIRRRCKVGGKSGNWLLDVRRVDESTLYNVPADVELPLIPLEFEEVKDNLRQVLETLTRREQTVLILRWGLDPKYYGGEAVKAWPKIFDKGLFPETKYGAASLNDVGQLLNLTKERIRQIESKALRKLRQSNRLRKLEGFFGIEDQLN